MRYADACAATMTTTHATWVVLVTTLTLVVGCGTRPPPRTTATMTEPAPAEPAANPTTSVASPTTWPTTLRRTRWTWRRDGTREPATIVIYRQHAWSRVLRPDLITAMWPDGEVIWSTDPVLGGPPYWRGRIEAGALRDLLHRMTEIAMRSGLPCDQVHTAPDASYNALYFRTAEGRIFSIGSYGDPYPDDELAGRDEHAWPRLAESWREMQAVQDWGELNYGSMVRLWGALRCAAYEALPTPRKQVRQPPVHFVRGGST